MSRLRKVVHLKVFDFEQSKCSYALNTKKNQFGYMFRNEYLLDNKKIWESPVYDEVEELAFYYLAFHINPSQMKSLKRRVNSLMKKGFAWEETENGLIMNFKGGSNLVYQGQHSEELLNKLLMKK